MQLNTLVIPINATALSSKQAVINTIQTAKDNSGKRVFHLTVDFLRQEAVIYPWSTASKCALFAGGLIAWPLIIVGSLACFNYYRLSPLKDITSDKEAMINYSNEGQAITYLVQGVELVLLPTAWFLIKGPYEKARYEITQQIYLEAIAKAEPEEIHFIVEMANRDLFPHSLTFGETSDAIQSETAQLKEVEVEIERQMSGKLSSRKILYLILKDEAREFTLKKGLLSCIVVGAALGAQHPLLVGVVGNLVAFNQKSPEALYSENPDELQEATNLFSNMGHVPEYLFTGLVICTAALKILFGKRYKAIRCGLINEIFDEQLQRTDLAPRVRDQLYLQKATLS